MKYLKAKKSLKKRKYFFKNEIKRVVICSLKKKSTNLYFLNLINFYFVN